MTFTNAGRSALNCLMKNSRVDISSSLQLSQHGRRFYSSRLPGGLGVERLVGGFAYADEAEPAGVPEAAEGDGDGAGVRRLAQLVPGSGG
jgi:hypothetical protein